MNLNITFYFIIIILIGTIFHLLFGYSMFDIFFIFPLNYGMTPHAPDLFDEEIPSDRVAIFILDGTRADSFFESIASGKSPFLRNILQNRGVYGVSHTEMPTESKPGFTAICSGHFEDASLALQDLSNSDILTDSIFNQSNHAWGIGVDSCMFCGVAKNMECVPFKGKQDYNDKECEKNNYLVFDTMINLFNKAKTDVELNKNLKKKKIAFLYHLIQTDTIGHKYGPKSKKLMNHLIVLDSYFEKLEKSFYDFYKDNRTTFIITSDHGMDMRKAHGDGNPDCTRTPFIIWGSGIRKSIYREKKPPKEDTPQNWELDNYVRKDISQIDITPLSAALIGINFPMNSLGILPLDILDISEKVKSKLLFTNFMQIFEIYKIKNDIAKKAKIFKSYKPLIDSDNKIKNILNEIDKGNYFNAINETQLLINTTLKGIDYILHYDRFYLKTIIVIGYILWMLYLFIFIEMKNDNNLKKLFIYESGENLSITIISGIIALILLIYLMLRLSPFLYYLYTLFPCYFFWRILANIKYIKIFFIKENGIKPLIKTIFFYTFIIISFLTYNHYFFLNIGYNV